ncbi:MAG: VWA domain-containing protein [Gaiellaceae bacterium]
MSFASPWLLLALVIVPASLALALWLDRRRAHYAVAFTNLELLASVAGRRRSWKRWVPLALFLLALAAASTALARPKASVTVPASRATVVLLVDVSGSMRAGDVKPTRLGAAQSAMAAFADRIPKTVKVGLVSFSTGPNLLVFPTTDRSIVHEGIDLLSPEAGTAIGDGLAVAVHTVKLSVADAPRGKDGKLPGAIVLLSDGAQTRGTLSPSQGAALARNAGIRVFTVALGTNNGTLDPRFGFGFGNQGGLGGGLPRRFPVRPDPATLEAIARETDGKSYRADSASKVQEIYKQLGASIAHKAAKREVSSWFAGGAALLLLLALGTARITGERLP